MGFDQDQLVPPVLRRDSWGRQDEKASETSGYFVGERETREKYEMMVSWRYKECEKDLAKCRKPPPQGKKKHRANKPRARKVSGGRGRGDFEFQTSVARMGGLSQNGPSNKRLGLETKYRKVPLLRAYLDQETGV